MNVIDARAVTRTFGAHMAVDRADLHVAAGEVVGLVGPNGAGKTTLIRMVLGLLTPTAGTIRLFGKPPTREQRRNIGYVPQNLGLYPDLAVAENLQFRAAVYGGAVDTSAAGDDADELVGSLAAGLQRRAAFTAALQHRSQLLVLDEPTSGVSPLARSRLWDLIRREAERDTAVLVSTHYMDEAVQADRLVVMVAGRVVAAGTTEEVIGNRTTLVVDADRWQHAFEVLDQAGYPTILAGRTIRIPLRTGNETHQVPALLDSNGVDARAHTAAATLDETLLDLAT